MKTIKITLTAAILLTTSLILPHTAVQAAKDVKTEPSTKKADHALTKGPHTTRTTSKNTSGNSQKLASKKAKNTKETSSNPSNMDINGKTHAELDNLAGKSHSGYATDEPVNDEE